MRGFRLPIVTSMAAILVFMSIFIFQGFTEEANRINIRLSARLSGILFCMAFVASSFQHFVKGQFSFWLLANRKFIGIAFALMHMIHLILLLILQLSFHPVFEIAKTSSLIGGGLAYLFAFLMFFTSFDQIKNQISNDHWKILHVVGGYWIWFIFFKSYWKRLMTEVEYLPLVILFLFVLLIRIMYLLSKRKWFIAKGALK